MPVFKQFVSGGAGIQAGSRSHDILPVNTVGQGGVGDWKTGFKDDSCSYALLE